MKPIIDYQFVIKYDSLSNELLLKLFLEYCNVFRPKSMLGENRKFDAKSEEEIKSLNLKFQGLLISGKDNSDFCFGNIVQNRLTPKNFFSIIYLLNKDSYLKEDILSFFLKINTLKMGFLLDSDYFFYQSTENPSEYMIKGLQYQHLPMYFNEYIQMDLIDISNNPGRERYLPGMKFIPAFKIWYGQIAQNLFGKEKILSYSNAIYTKELANGVIEMQLMDKIDKCHLPYNQEKQKDIIKYFEIEKLEVSKY